MGNYDKSIEHFNKAIELDSNDANSFFNMGKCLHKLDKI